MSPLIFYLYALPVWLARHFAFLTDYQALVLLSLCAIAATIFLCMRLVRAHP